MLESPSAGPSEPRSNTVDFTADKGRETLPLLSEESMSRRKPQYTTSGENMPIPPVPSNSPNTEADRGAPTNARTADQVDLRVIANETDYKPSIVGSANPDEPSFARNRLAALYHKCNPQMILENRGSTARDHLASERTFLAYVRTSLALASAGVALVQLFTSNARQTPVGGEAGERIQRFAQPLGVSTVVLALIMLGIAVYRYFLIQVALPRNTFPVARLSVVFVTFSLSVVVVVIFALLAAR